MGDSGSNSQQHPEVNNNNRLVENPGQSSEDSLQDSPNNPPSQEEAIDGEVQARFLERALAESARLRREADRS